MSQYEPETTVVHREGETVVVEKVVPVREGTSPAIWALVGVLAVIVVIAVAWLFTRNDDDAVLDAQADAAAAAATAQAAVIDANAARADAALAGARAQIEAATSDAARAAADSANAAAARAEAAAAEARMAPPADGGGAVIITPSTPQP